jgi:elongation factor G
MPPRRIDLLRNLGIIAHIDAGKTTVTERMLFYSGATHRMGDVDKGTTETDFDPEEQQRGITIYSACVSFPWGEHTINLIDTPGHVDFTAEVERSLRVLDGAVVVFSAREGVEAQSETVWRQADKYGVPRLAFINKMDREGASFEDTLEQMRKRLDTKPAPIAIPLGVGPPHLPEAFRGIIDLVEMKLLTFEKQALGRNVVAQEIPPEARDEADLWRGQLLDDLSIFSDALAEVLLEEQQPTPELVRQVLREATLARQIVPVLCGSALDYIGIQPLLDAVGHYLPSPLDKPPVVGTNPKKKDAEETRAPDPKEPFSGLVFKVLADKHGDLHIVRIYSGTLSANTRVLNAGKDKKENAAQLWHIQADRKEQIPEAQAGDIVGVIGLRQSITGDTICETQHPIVLESIVFPETVISMAIEPESSTERKKLSDVLEMMKRQDPTFRASESEETGQTLISGMGELHLEVIKHRLLRDFNLNVKVHKPRVSYRETIERAADAEGECHRLIGGQQLFGKLRVKLEPIADNTAPVIVRPEIFTQLPEPLVTAAVDELTERVKGGGLYGNPLIRVKLTVMGGEAVEGQSTDVAFRIAAADAFDKALQKAGGVLLEPIMKLEITTPEEHVGDFVSDLQQRRGMITQTNMRGRNTVIDAEVPLSNLFGYSSAMRGLSQGRASCSMEPAAYGPAPPEVAASFR